MWTTLGRVAPPPPLTDRNGMQECQSHSGRTRDQRRPPRRPGARMQATREPAGHAVRSHCSR
eukprot:540542-Pyramimonas_sp.AAC.1